MLCSRIADFPPDRQWKKNRAREGESRPSPNPSATVGCTAPAKIASSASTNDFKNAGGGAVLTEWIVSEVVVLWPIVTHSPGSGELPLVFPLTVPAPRRSRVERPLLGSHSGSRLICLKRHLSRVGSLVLRFARAGRPTTSPQGSEPAGAGSLVGAADQVYRLFLIFAASSVCALLMCWDHRSNAANAFGVGWVIEGFAGQTTMTKLGLVPSGWWSSIPEPVARTGAAAAGEHGG